MIDGFDGGVAIIVPVLRRPHRAAPLVASIVRHTPAPFTVLFVCTANDHAEQDAVTATGCEWVNAGPWQPGDYMRKVNLGITLTTEPLVFLAADDLRFRNRWLEHAAAELTDEHHVVGTNDLGNRRVVRGEHSTHSLLTRAYAERGTIDEPAKVLHEGYHHNFCDDEFVATARHRGAFTVAKRSVVEHLHPHWRKADDDDTYRLGQRYFARDRRLFESRRHLWA